MQNRSPVQRRSAVAGLVALLMLVLSGCLNMEAELGVDGDAKVSGDMRVEINKQVAMMIGATSLDSFKALMEEEEAEGDQNECAEISYDETDEAYVVTCTYDGADLSESGGAVQARVVGDTVEVRFENEGDDSGENPFGTSGPAGSLKVELHLPGAVTEIGGQTPQLAVQDGDDVVRIEGTPMETMDVTIVSERSGGSGGSFSGSGDDSNTGVLIAIGAVVVLVLIGVVAALVLRGRNKPAASTTPAAPTAGGPMAPGWYPMPGDPSGQSRYWDGTSWSDGPPQQ